MRAKILGENFDFPTKFAGEDNTDAALLADNQGKVVKRFRQGATMRRKLVNGDGSPTPTPTPAPVFSVQPSISPTGGTAGETTFTASDGTASNTTAYTRRWLLNGTAIGTAATILPASDGSLVLEVTATGEGGSTVETSSAVTVVAATTPGEPTAPVLTQTSASGTNPIAWGTAYTDLIPDDEDYVVLRYRVDGGAWVTEDPVLVTSAWVATYIVDGDPHPWPFYDAAIFTAGEVVEVQGGVTRGAAATVWSNTISDTIAGAPATASIPLEKTEFFSVGYGSNTVTMTAVPFETGVRIIFLNHSDAADRVVTGITCGGVACTKRGELAAGAGVEVWTAPAAAAGNEDVVVTWNMSLGSTRLYAFTGIDVGSEVPSDFSRLLAASLPDPKVFSDTLVVPANGAGVGILRNDASTNITVANGTELFDNNAGSAVASYPPGTLTPEFSGGIHNNSWGFAAAWAPA